MRTTTLSKIKSCNPYKTGWEKLLRGLNKTEADDDPVTIRQIIEINGLYDAIWYIRAFDFDKKQRIKFAYDCVKSVERLLIEQHMATQPHLDDDAIESSAARASAYASAWVYITDAYAYMTYDYSCVQVVYAAARAIADNTVFIEKALIDLCENE